MQTLRNQVTKLHSFFSAKSSKKLTRTVQNSLFSRNIHIPPLLIAILSSALFLILLTLGMGWSWKNFLSVTIFTSIALPLFIFYLMRDTSRLVLDDEAMMCLGTLALLFIAVIAALKKWPASFYLTPLPAASILAALLLHPRISLALSILLAVIQGMAQGFSFDCFILVFLVPLRERLPPSLFAATKILSALGR